MANGASGMSVLHHQSPLGLSTVCSQVMCKRVVIRALRRGNEYIGSTECSHGSSDKSSRHRHYPTTPVNTPYLDIDELERWLCRHTVVRSLLVDSKGYAKGLM